MVTAHQLGDGEHVFLTIGLDAFQVVFLPIHATYFAPVDVILWGGDVQDGAEQIQGSEGLIVAEFPELHRVEEVGFPRFLACNLQYLRNLNPVDEHPSGDVGEVEFLAVVGAELGVWRVEMSVQHVGKVGKQGFLIVPIKRLQAETVAVEEPHGNTDDFAEFRIDAGAIVDVGRAEFRIVVVQLFSLVRPEFLLSLARRSRCRGRGFWRSLSYQLSVYSCSVKVPELVEGPTYILQLSNFLKIIIFSHRFNSLNLHIGNK